MADKDGKTPIFWAAQNGHTEIVKILAPLTDNPNAQNDYGITPSLITKNAEIRRFLESFNTSRKRNDGLSIEPSNKRAKILATKTIVEILVNGNTDNVNWIEIAKPPNSITLKDILPFLKRSPKMYGLSDKMMYNYKVKTTDNGKVGFELLDEDEDRILPLFGDKIELQCWSKIYVGVFWCKSKEFTKKSLKVFRLKAAILGL